MEQSYSDSTGTTALESDVEIAKGVDLPSIAAPEPKFYSSESVRAAWVEPTARERKSRQFGAAVLGEFCATFSFVFLTTTVANRFGHDHLVVEATTSSVSLAFGFAIAMGVHTYAHVSGAHFNPAVTLALFFSLQCSIFRLVCYVSAQLVASLVASLAVYGSLPGDIRDTTSLGANTLNTTAGYSAAQGFFYEFLGTAFFVLVIFATIDPAKNQSSGMGALAIGLAGSVAHFALVPVTGCGINPARSFGPNMIAEALTKVNTVQGSYWIYWAGPLLGGSLGGLLYTTLFAANRIALQNQGLIGRFRSEGN